MLLIFLAPVLLALGVVFAVLVFTCWKAILKGIGILILLAAGALSLAISHQQREARAPSPPAAAAPKAAVHSEAQGNPLPGVIAFVLVCGGCVYLIRRGRAVGIREARAKARARDARGRFLPRAPKE